MLKEIGAGSADDAVLIEILGRAGRPTDPPNANWQLSETVRNLSYEPKNKPFLQGSPTLPANAQEMLDAWPIGAKTARWLLVEFAPCHDPRYAEGSDNTFGGCFGCKTDNIEDFGRIYSSKTDPVGCIEGLVSSLANWKLYALGIKHYEWTNEFILVPKEGKTFSHPLRSAEQVPAGTVLHTVYCSLHVLAWYRALQANFGTTPGSAYRIGVWKERISRAVELMKEIKGQTTQDGSDLLTGMLTWADELLAVED